MLLDSIDETAAELFAKPLALAMALSLVAGLLASVGKPWDKFFHRSVANVTGLVALSLPVVALGFVCGYLTGASREAAIGSLITSALTLIGGVSLLLFQGKAGHASQHVGYTVFAFACSIFFGVENGSFNREFRQEDRFNKLSQQEYKIKIYRRNLLLPDDPPSWIMGAPEKK
jgi:hypothetical protein